MAKHNGKPRNPFHNHPLLRKGGVHEKTNKAKRKGEKQKLKMTWCCLSALLSVIKQHHLYGAVA